GRQRRRRGHGRFDPGRDQLRPGLDSRREPGPNRRRRAGEPEPAEHQDRADRLPPSAGDPRREPRRRLSRLSRVRAGRRLPLPAERGASALRLPDRRGVPAVSLLLEALKKAELAKQQGTATQPGESLPPPDQAGSGLSLEPGPGPQTRPPLITRDRLPDITQPLEILSEDLPSAGARREPSPVEPGGAPAVAPAPVSPRASADPGEAARQAARQAEERDRLSAAQLVEP